MRRPRSGILCGDCYVQPGPPAPSVRAIALSPKKSARPRASYGGLPSVSTGPRTKKPKYSASPARASSTLSQWSIRLRRLASLAMANIRNSSNLARTEPRLGSKSLAVIEQSSFSRSPIAAMMLSEFCMHCSRNRCLGRRREAWRLFKPSKKRLRIRRGAFRGSIRKLILGGSDHRTNLISAKRPPPGCVQTPLPVAFLVWNHDLSNPVFQTREHAMPGPRRLFGIPTPSQMHLTNTTIIKLKQHIISLNGPCNGFEIHSVQRVTGREFGS